MQDWSMIPIYIRLTERNKIDPRYPQDDAKWWKMQDMAARRQSFGSENAYARVPDIVAEWYINQPDEGPRVTAEAAAGALSIPVGQFNGAIKNYKRFGSVKQRPPSFYSGQMSESEASRDPYLQKA